MLNDGHIEEEQKISNLASVNTKDDEDPQTVTQGDQNTGATYPKGGDDKKLKPEPFIDDTCSCLSAFEEETPEKMVAEEVCRYNQFGYCKFGYHCFENIKTV